MPLPPDVMDEKLQRRRKEDRLAADILDECRVQLMLKFRFLDLALWRMELVPARIGARYPLATDAQCVVFDPPWVIARFNESFEESVRDYLHLVMHCIFRHPYDKEHDNREAWSLTCDIMVESAVMDLVGDRFASPDDSERRQALSEMQMLVGHMLPYKVYALMKALVQTPDGQRYRGLSRAVLGDWHRLFERDDHGAWPATNSSKPAGDEDAGVPNEAAEDEEQADRQPDGLLAESFDDGDGSRSGSEQEDSLAAEESVDPGGEDDGEDEAGDEREWADIAKRIEMNLETFSKEWGDEAGSLMANLAVANRRTCGYADFLRRFMVVSEEMQLNPDEFDYVYYTYGLDRYGNMPLIEPLEYRETQLVRDFAIVIDTSESVSGPLVEKFLAHTFGILKSAENYASEVNVHVIQCDARVQSDTKITSLADVDEVMEGFRVRGFGGTDFRPAFDYVDMLRKTGELAHLKGLVYFTDGLGQFPEKTPPFDAAFVFMDEGEGSTPPVPPWACKAIIDEAAVNRLGEEQRSDRIRAERNRAL